ncbi:MAG TPA: ATP-dependent DNA ligase [Tepidisphaeraceae bacterium]|jgi:ATP-dependent DNA ligase|nr:ATP-dependent DNA ligase [Tepidisphaeraceae bacterium]
MALPIPTSYEPMNAKLVSEIPQGDNWQYEPKWDGFRALVFREGKKVHLQSKSGQPLERYFPEIVQSVLKLKADKFIIDGEIVIPEDGGLSFDALLQRIHPAESRIKKLAKETPGKLIIFDILAENGKALVDQPLSSRRKKLETFAKKYFRGEDVVLSPATTRLAEATRWFGEVGGALDGIIAKRTDLAYQSGNRDGMVKVKNMRTADCVVGGFRYAANARIVGSLLLGLYDENDKLNHVGFCSSLSTAERKALTPKLEKLIEPPGFTGNAPGGPSRWSTKRSSEWEPLKNTLVVEVQYDHFTGGRFRHGTKLLRWRPDKSPKQCTLKQVKLETAQSPLKLTRSKSRTGRAA